MGSGSSRPEETKLVALCRERRDLIAAAADRSRALASTHDAYFRALGRVGDALRRFVQEELSVGQPSLPSFSPALTLDSPVGKAASCLSNSPSISVREGSHLHLSDDDADEEESSKAGVGGVPSSSPIPRPFAVSPTYYYMKHSSSIPSVIYQPPSPIIGNGHAPNGRYGSFPKAGGRPPTPPPPPPQGSTWDFLDPFGTYEQIYSRYKMGSVASSINSTEVREREGIPELEDETDSEVANGINRRKAEKKPGKDNGSKAPPLAEEHLVMSSPECIASVSSGGGSKSKNSERESKWEGNADEESVGKKGSCFEVATSFTTERSGPSVGTALFVQGTRDVRDVVQEIKQQFVKAHGHGEELSRFLRVGKFRHRLKSNVFRVASSRILDSFSMMAYSFPAFNLSQFHAKTAFGGSPNNFGTRDISSILEKLYFWEEKLHQEIKDEEKLRVLYEKKFEHLRSLKGRSSESDETDPLLVMLIELNIRIDVAIRSITAISCSIEKLRDKELQPHLVVLIQSFIRMWKCLLDCHQKQYLAIVDCKAHNLKARTSVGRTSVVAKATRELEAEIMNWSSCFKKWLNAQKAYVEALNAWLLSWVDTEPEVTPDGIAPFSPGRVGAPAVLIMCNDWYQAMKTITEDEVTMAMDVFARNVHELVQIQDEEHRQKLKSESLTKDIAKRFGSIQKEKATRLHVSSSEKNSISFRRKGTGSINDRMNALDSMRRRLLEEKSKHKETVNRLHNVASNILRGGLIPVYEAFGIFILDALKAYEGLRIPGVEKL